MELIKICENNIHMVFEIDDEKCLKLLHFSALPFKSTDIIAESTEYGFRFVEMNLSGFDRPYERHGNKFIVTAPGYRMKYVKHTDERNALGRKLTYVLQDEVTDVFVDSFVQFYDGKYIV